MVVVWWLCVVVFKAVPDPHTLTVVACGWWRSVVDVWTVVVWMGGGGDVDGWMVDGCVCHIVEADIGRDFGCEGGVWRMWCIIRKR